MGQSASLATSQFPSSTPSQDLATIHNMIRPAAVDGTEGMNVDKSMDDQVHNQDLIGGSLGSIPLNWTPSDDRATVRDTFVPFQGEPIIADIPGSSQDPPHLFYPGEGERVRGPDGSYHIPAPEEEEIVPPV